MNHFIALVLVSSFAVVGGPADAAAADFVRLPSLKRVAENTYTSGKYLVVTRYCHERSRGDAILKFVGRGEYTGNKVFFENGNHCDVKAVYDRPTSNTKCNSRTGNSALDIFNNARCRDIEAQKFNQANAHRADQMQTRLDADKSRLAAAQAESKRRVSGLHDQAESARREAEASARRTAAYERFFNYFNAKTAAIAKIKDPTKRARAYEQLQKEAVTFRNKLIAELK